VKEEGGKTMRRQKPICVREEGSEGYGHELEVREGNGMTGWFADAKEAEWVGVNGWLISVRKAASGV